MPLSIAPGPPDGRAVCSAAMMISVSKIVQLAAGEDAAAWRDALAQPGWASAATVLKEDRGSWVRRANLLGRDVVVKCRELNTIGRRFKHAIGMGHGAKHWRGAERLMRAGIATGRLLALMRMEVGGKRCEVLVLEFVEGKTLLEVLDEVARGVGPGVREQHAIARAVGQTIAAMDEACCHNRDLKPSNLIVAPADHGGAKIAVIDCVGVRRCEDTHANLTALTIEPIGCGCPPRRALWLSVLAFLYGNRTRSREFRLCVHEIMLASIWSVEHAVQQHGDPRPRISPLSNDK